MGDYPVEPVLELAFFKMEHKEELSSCTLCGRILTNPRSIKLQVGPDCLKKIGDYGKGFMEGDKVSQELMKASKQYSNPRFQNWVIKAVLTLKAPLPYATLEWQGEEYFGYTSKPSLYYLDCKNNLNCIEICKRKLAHRQIPDESACIKQLDYRAFKMVETAEVEFETMEIEQIDESDISPYSEKEWLIKSGNRRVIVYQEKGSLWCNCRKKNCEHLHIVEREEGNNR
jgi:hypothetical protein